MVSGKSVTSLSAFVCGFALVFGLSGCDKDSGQPPQEPNAAIETPVTGNANQEPVKEPPTETTATVQGTAQIVPLVGVGPITFGMTKEQVIELWGQPDQMQAGGIAMYYLSGHVISLLLEYKGGVREIQCWSDNYPMQPQDMTVKTCAEKTQKGIGLGASRKEIIAAYGQTTSTASRGPVETLRYGELKTSFDLADNKLVGIRMQAP